MGGSLFDQQGRGVFMSKRFTWRYDLDYILDYILNPKYVMISFLIVGPFLLILGSGLLLFNQNRAASKCTSQTYGMVVSVEQEKGTIFTDSYVATVEPIDSSIFNGTKSFTVKSSYAYEKGKYVQIQYDPSDPATYYVEHSDSGERGYTFIITGVVVTLLGVAAFGICKAMKKTGAFLQ